MKFFVILAFYLGSCTTETSDPRVAGGAGAELNWYKTPEEIKNTIEGWGIQINESEQTTYFERLGELYGGLVMSQQQTLVGSKPNATYVLALDMLSLWLSKRLIIAQCHEDLKNKEDERGGVFDGGPFTSESDNCDRESENYCYQNKDKNWCDCRDGIKVNTYTNSTILTAEDKKKIMHNIQDIGDFLGFPIDNLLVVEGYDHAPHYLFETIFKDALQEPALIQQNDKQSVTVKSVPADSPPSYSRTEICGGDKGGFDEREAKGSDVKAWQQVIHALLMSGPFYMNL